MEARVAADEAAEHIAEERRVTGSVEGGCVEMDVDVNLQRRPPLATAAAPTFEAAKRAVSLLHALINPACATDPHQQEARVRSHRSRGSTTRCLGQ